MAEEERNIKKNKQQSISRANIFINRFIKDDHTGSYDLNRYVTQYDEAIQPIIAETICSKIMEKITLQNHKRLLKGLDSLKMYFPIEKFQRFEKRVRDICEEYESEKEESHNILYGEREKPIRDTLSRQGISGDAIVVNIEALTEWNTISDELDSRYNRLLKNLKDVIINGF